MSKFERLDLVIDTGGATPWQLFDKLREGSRFEFDGLGVVRVCTVQVSFGSLHNTAVVVGLCKIRFKFDGFGEVGNCIVQVAFGSQ